MSEESTYAIKPCPPFRRLVTDGLEIASRKHLIHGLIEVGVTKPRQRLRELKVATGESFSFTGFIVYCCAKAVDKNKYQHAYHHWRNQLIRFDDVDISLGVERSANFLAVLTENSYWMSTQSLKHPWQGFPQQDNHYL